MVMTKRHFEALARVLREAHENVADEHRETVSDVACAIAQVCGEHNPRFDYARFLRACGVTND